MQAVVRLSSIPVVVFAIGTTESPVRQTNCWRGSLKKYIEHYRANYPGIHAVSSGIEFTIE